jgi:tRNA(Ile)-lysidine synthase
MERPLHEVEKLVADAWPPHQWRDVTVIVAVSGGADSVALLRAACALRHSTPGRLLVGHLNHHLRGEESDQDEAFVRQLAETLNCPCFVGHADSLGDDTPDGLESAARQVRYRFLKELADRQGARFVAVAHNLDDQAETILHRIVRGTGISGLAGIPAIRRLSDLTTIVRPLLAVGRDQLREYLHEIGQAFREDSSNAELHFTRNRMRHALIPLLESHYNRNVTEALVRLGNYAAQVQEVIDELVAKLLDDYVTGQDNRILIACSPLVGQPQHIRCELLIAAWKQRHWPLQAMTGQKWEQLADLMTDEPWKERKVCFPGNVVAERVGQQLVLSRSP